MVGNIKWNVWLSSVGMILTFLLSLNNNVWLTSLYRAIYCFIALFIISFILRWFLRQMMNNQQAKVDQHVGTHIDLSTPDDQAEPHQQQTEHTEQVDAKEDPFAPLNPPRFTTKEPKASDADTEQIVQAIRHMSED